MVVRALSKKLLTKNATSRVQPLDAGIIASIKRRFRRGEMDRATDMIEDGVTKNSYSIDLYNKRYLGANAVLNFRQMLAE